MSICILGLGHIGLPTAAVMAAVGHSVVGVDTNPQVIHSLRNGNSHLEEPQLGEALKAALKIGKLQVCPSPTQADVFVIAVPTPATADKHSDLSHVLAAGRAIAPVLKQGNLVILESTVPPFTTERMLAPVLENSGLKAGSDFFLAYSPERVMPGRTMVELVHNDRVVGGVNRRSAEMARDIYQTFVEGEICLTDAATAEMVKLMENTYRDVNIALANELAILAQEAGLDIWKATTLANRHPRVNIHLPGPGVGGHCIAVDPWFLAQMSPQEPSIIRTARQINDNMPSWVISMLAGEVPPANASVAILGVTYKGNVDDTRESPALDVVRRAQELGYEVRIHDPHVKCLPGLPSPVSLEEAVTGSRALLVLADHTEFQRLDVSLVASLMAEKVLLDTRNCLDHRVWQDHGFRVLLLGKGPLC